MGEDGAMRLCMRLLREDATRGHCGQQRVGSQVWDKRWDKGQGIAPTCPQLLNDEMKIGTSTAAMANCPG